MDSLPSSDLFAQVKPMHEHSMFRERNGIQLFSVYDNESVFFFFCGMLKSIFLAFVTSGKVEEEV